MKRRLVSGAAPLAVCVLVVLGAACKAEPRPEARSTTSTSASAAAAPRVLYLPDTTAAAASSAPAPSAPPTSPAPSAKPAEKLRYRVAAMGDSLTDARVGGGKFLKYLQERCPESVFDNYGVGGEMVNQMRRRFARDVLQKRVGPEQLPYSHVVVFGGVNDLYSDQTAGRSNDKIQGDLQAMYGAAKAAGMQVVALTVAPWGGFTRYWNERRGQNTVALNGWIAGRLQQDVDHVVDTYPMLSCGTPTKLCPDYEKPYKDGLHFGPEGHSRVGAALYAQVFGACR